MLCRQGLRKRFCHHACMAVSNQDRANRRAGLCCSQAGPRQNTMSGHIVRTPRVAWRGVSRFDECGDFRTKSLWHAIRLKDIKRRGDKSASSQPQSQYAIECRHSIQNSRNVLFYQGPRQVARFMPFSRTIAQELRGLQRLLGSKRRAGEGHLGVTAHRRRAIGRLERKRHLRPRPLGSCHGVLLRFSGSGQRVGRGIVQHHRE